MSIIDFFKSLFNNPNNSNSNYRQNPMESPYALFDFVERGDFVKLEYLLDNFDFYYPETKQGKYDIVMFAILHRQPEMVELLANNKNIDVNTLTISYENEFGVFPLAQAVAIGDEDSVDALINSGRCNLNIVNKKGVGVYTFALNALREHPANIKSISNCITKIIKNKEFRGNDADYTLDFLLSESINNNLKNVIEAFCSRPELLHNNESVINLIYNIVDELQNGDDEQTICDAEMKGLITKMLVNVCKLDEEEYEMFKKQLEEFDLSQITLETAYEKSKNSVAYSEKLFYKFIAKKKGCEINIPDPQEWGCDLSVMYCMANAETPTKTKEYFDSYKGLCEKIKGLYDKKILSDDAKLIIEYIDKILSLQKKQSTADDLKQMLDEIFIELGFDPPKLVEKKGGFAYFPHKNTDDSDKN